MKLKRKACPGKVQLALSVDDIHRITMFVQVLVQIDRRVNPNKKTQKKSAKKSSITSITKGPQFREPYFAKATKAGPFCFIMPLPDLPSIIKHPFDIIIGQDTLNTIH